MGKIFKISLKKTSFFLSFMILLSFGGFFQTAFAGGIILSPPKFEFSTDPGKSITGVVKITNNSNAKMTLQSDVKDFIAGGETGQPSFVDPKLNESGISLGNWITVNDGKTVEVEIGEKKEIPFVVNVPADAEPGGHYGSIFFFEKAGNSQIAVVRKIGSLILVKVSGEIREEGHVEEFSVGMTEKDEFKNNFLFTDYPVDFSLRFKNTGNIHIKPEGEIKIYNTFGSQLKSIGAKSLLNSKGVEVGKEIVDCVPVNEKKGNILSNSIRKFDVSFNGKVYRLKGENGGKSIKYKGDSDNGFIGGALEKIKNTGFYKVELKINGPKGEIITEEGSFVFFAFKEIFGLLLLIILFCYGFTKYRKYSKEKFEKELESRLKAMNNSGNGNVEK